MFYFAYGSNLAEQRLRHRIPQAQPACAATLANYELAFNVLGGDGSAKANVIEKHGSKVTALLFDISKSDKLILDKYEGLGIRYQIRQAQVTTTDNRQIAAYFYLGISLIE